MKKIFILFMIFICIFSCSTYNFKSNMYDMIMACNLQCMGDSCAINMNDFFEFSWESMFIFGPYSSHEVVSEVLGIKYKDGGLLTLTSYDEESRYIFLMGKEIVYEEDINSFDKKKIWEFKGDTNHSYVRIDSPYIKVTLKECEGEMRRYILESMAIFENRIGN